MVFKRIVRDYFTFNKRERRGLIALILILSCVSFLHIWIRFSPSDSKPLTQAEIEQIDALAAQLTKEPEPEFIAAENQSDSSHSIASNESAIVDEINWFEFDPNTVSLEDLQRLGLKSYIAKNWVNYRKGGAEFYELKDVARIYGMDSTWIDQARGFMSFPEKPVFTKPEKKKFKPELLSISLNEADSAEFTKIRGVGPFYASQIVKLRESLGGIHSYDQLNTIWKIKPETIEAIKKNTELDTNLITKLKLNSASVEQLAAHKYIDWKLAKIIVAYRESHGPYRQKADLMKTDVINREEYLKIAPYLSLD